MIATSARSTLVLGVIAAALALSGCAGGPGAQGPEPGETGGTVDVIGVWGDPDASGEPSLEFAEDGTVSGTDGCNQLGGQYAVEGDTVTFSGMHTTLMACEGVDAWLGGAATAAVDGESMTVYDDSGDRLGTLDRHS